MTKRNKKGFTLAELLIVIAIIAVLMAIMFPVFGAQLDKAKAAAAAANVRSAYSEEVADQMLEDDFNGTVVINQAKLMTRMTNNGVDTTGITITVNTTDHKITTQYKTYTFEFKIDADVTDS